MAGIRTLVVAGLGNYTHPLTRHSVSQTRLPPFSCSPRLSTQIGQLLLVSLAAKAASLPGARGSPTLLLNKQLQAYTSTVTLSPPRQLAVSAQGVARGDLQITFVKPRVLMNISGPVLLSALSSTKSKPSRLITLQDDLDLLPPLIKAQLGGSPRGHNGVRSTERSLSSKNFWRIRLGIGRPGPKSEGRSVADWVMGPLGRDEVRSCEWDENGGGEMLRKVWDEIMRIGWMEEEEVVKRVVVPSPSASVDV